MREFESLREREREREREKQTDVTVQTNSADRQT